MNKTTLFVLIAMITSILSFSQEHTGKEQEHQEPQNIEEPRHRVAFILGHSYISLDNNEILAIPSFGLDYEYWLSKHWGVGVFSDVELITKELSPSVDGESIEREYPVVVTLDVLWSPIKHWEFVLGPGIISEKGEVESLVRFGVEHDLALGHHWDVALNVFYDQLFNGNHAVSIGIGIAKRF
jgi:hypothetical protein